MRFDTRFKSRFESRFQSRFAGPQAGVFARSYPYGEGYLRKLANGGMLLNAALDPANYQTSAGIDLAGAGDPVGLALDTRGGTPQERVNLLTHSQDFSNAAWTKFRASIAAGPSEGLQIIEATETNGGGSYVTRTVTVASAAPYSLQAEVASANTDWVLLFLSVGAAQERRWFNASTGEVGSSSASGGGLTGSALSVAATSDGWKISFSVTTTGTSLVVGIFAVSGNNSFASTIGDSIVAGRAQLETGSTATAYQPVGATYPTTWPDLNFTSATTARPLRGRNPKTGRNNLFNVSEPTVSDLVVSGNVTNATTPIPGFANGIQFGDGSVTRFAYVGPALEASTQYTIGVYVVMDDGGVPVYGASSAQDLRLAIGNQVVATGSVTAQGDNVYLVQATGNSSGASSPNTGVIKSSGSSARGFRVSGYHINPGSTLATYQRVITINDVTEAGVPDVWFYRPDGINDNLTGNAAARAIFQNCDVGYFACIVEHASLNGEYIASWSAGDNGTNQRLGLKASSTGELIAEVRRADADTTASTTSTAGDIVTGTKQFVMVVVNWTAGTVALYVDDAVTAAATGSTPAGTGASADTASLACTLMSQSDDTDYLDGQLWGYIAAGRTDPSLFDRQLIKQQLERKAGM